MSSCTLRPDREVLGCSTAGASRAITYFQAARSAPPDEAPLLRTFPTLHGVVFPIDLLALGIWERGEAGSERVDRAQFAGSPAGGASCLAAGAHHAAGRGPTSQREDSEPVLRGRV